MSNSEVTVERLSRFACPRCGNNGTGNHHITYLERGTVENMHRVRGLWDGVLSIQGFHAESEMMGSVEKAFWCRRCGHRWPVPDWMPIAF